MSDLGAKRSCLVPKSPWHNHILAVHPLFVSVKSFIFDEIAGAQESHERGLQHQEASLGSGLGFRAGFRICGVNIYIYIYIYVYICVCTLCIQKCLSYPCHIFTVCTSPTNC